MSVGTGIIGRQVIVTIGGQSFLGVQTKGLSITAEGLETTDDNSNGNPEFLAIPGGTSRELSISGQVKNLAGLQAALSSGSKIYHVTIQYPEGSIVEGDFFMGSYNDTGTYNELYTFDMTLSSSGELTFTPGEGSQE